MSQLDTPEKRWDYAFSVILEHEGGFINDKHDPGGATKYGVSLRFLKASGIDINLDGHIDITDIFILNKENAKEIYYKYWWDKFKYNSINDIYIATKVVDLSVNMGDMQAHKLVQRAVNSLAHPPLVVDGVLGNKSISAINGLCKAGQHCPLLDAIKNQACVFYVTLAAHNPDLNKYLKGWLRRAND